jgi:hypothetical protein
MEENVTPVLAGSRLAIGQAFPVERDNTNHSEGCLICGAPPADRIALRVS